VFGEEPQAQALVHFPTLIEAREAREKELPPH
jgi:hypothetical protein